MKKIILATSIVLLSFIAVNLYAVQPVVQPFVINGSKMDCPAFTIYDIPFADDNLIVLCPQKSLKKLAEKPVYDEIKTTDSGDKSKEIAWLGGKIRSIDGLGDRSAYGLPDEKGVLVLEVTKGSLLDKSGIKTGDVILKSSGKVVEDVVYLIADESISRYKSVLEMVIIRNQQMLNRTILLK